MQDISAQITYWDRVANEKRFSHPLRLEWLKQYLENTQFRILDYGCGYGRTLAGLSDSGYRKLFKLPEGVVVRHHTKEWIEEIMSPFERLEYEPFEVRTMNGNSSAAFQYLARKP